MSTIALPTADRGGIPHWFAPSDAKNLARFRVAVALVACVHFASYALIADAWYGKNAWLNVESSRYLIGEGIPGTGSLYRQSLLFTAPETGVAIAWLGLLSSVTLLLGIGSRLAPLIAWACASMFIHRSPLLASLHEPLLSAALLYLVVDPGRTQWSWRMGLATDGPRTTATLAQFLIACHLWIWLVFSLLSMLMHSVWLEGSAVGALMRSQQSWIPFANALSPLGPLFTYLVLILQAAAIVGMLRSSWSKWARISFLGFALCVLLLSGDWMYAAILVAASLAVWPLPVRTALENRP